MVKRVLRLHRRTAGRQASRLLLDTHILIHVVSGTSDLVPHRHQQVLADHRSTLKVSVVSLWEIAIKMRLGKLGLPIPLVEVHEFFTAEGFGLLPITARHVMAEVDPWPPTRDPFDRLLLAQAQVEGLRLMTLDRALVDHPLAWRAEV
ncbi:type II toxin-antitoxin system VapC family toxin [Prosthecodimorpha staleyi]|uniref:Type II toxin-antitoxin system VapC family toxin n=1 Tax=Prosthecodimorpha staleyi TaxID=2840188 RepID=A0A947GE70_9HYPH|nr:type II toxin-antitoxin system VapC family toxin [Prosthecodimorpha staleyi]MBT9289025.1 type II toxin-antitoxin system VapC family toxin [Prosthecodimorpha staleyi]